MKTHFFLFVLSLLLILCGCSRDNAGTAEIREIYPESLSLVVGEVGGSDGSDDVIFLNIPDIKNGHPSFNANAFVVFSKTNELPCQSIDTNNDGSADRIAVLTDLSAGQQQQLTLFYARTGIKKRDYPKRTQAEVSHKINGHFEDRKYIGGEFHNVQVMNVPPEHTDHSYFIRYEGPGWESDKVGYRFYLDWRNATDIFGKKTPGMVLQNIGQDGFDSYHEMADWGMDILKVGESLGIGSIGMWYDGKAHRVAKTDSISCQIVENGPLYSQVSTTYWGWETAGKKHNLISDLSIIAGSRLTRHNLQVSGNPSNLCTGIVKHPGTTLVKKSGKPGGWGYLATYGQQSLSGDKLGMAVFFKESERISFENDQFNEVVVLKPTEGTLQYFFLGAWEQEPGGIQSESEFMAYLETLAVKLDSPLTVKY